MIPFFGLVIGKMFPRGKHQLMIDIFFRGNVSSMQGGIGTYIIETQNDYIRVTYNCITF